MLFNDLKDVRPPVDLPANYLWLIVVLGLAVIVVLVFWGGHLKAKLSRKKTAPVIARLAWEIAQEELAALEAENLPSKGQKEEYFIRLSAIIRHYLERRFFVSAPEMTTDEFLIHMKTIPVLNLQQKDSLKEFLTLSDMVKFARHHSTSKEMDEAMIAAKCLIEETIPNVESSPSQL